MGHAVYSISGSPRGNIFKAFVQKPAAGKGHWNKEYGLYSAGGARLRPRSSREERRIYKGVSANIDFYSGFVYHMLGLPTEAVHARLRHGPHRRLERPPAGGASSTPGKIIRPAYMSISERRSYVPMENR